MAGNLLATIVRSKWLIDPRYAEGYLPLIAQLIKGEPVNFHPVTFHGKPGAFRGDEIKDSNEKKHAVYTLAPKNGTFYRNDLPDAVEPGSIAVLRLCGVVMKEDDFCGIPGTQTLRGNYNALIAHENVIGTVMHIDSPGGQVDGTFEFSDAIAAGVAAGKPHVTYIDGLCASAGYAIACPSSEIYASHATAEIGSIGTRISFYDYSKALEEMGVKLHYINADTSPDKSQDYLQALGGNYKPIKEHILNPTNDIFLDTVKAARPGVSKDALTGNVFLSRKAQELGLIDGIGTFEQVVNRCYELATSNNPK